MCLQCLVDAQSVIRFILPGNPNADKKSVNVLGWHIYVAKKEHGDNTEWPKGFYGLLRINDPAFVFPLDLSKNVDDLDWDEIYNQFDCEPIVGYDFYEACVRVGYNRMHGVNVVRWFIEYLVDKLKQLNLHKENTANNL